MLREVLEHTGLEPARTAALLGFEPTIFNEWISNQREMPASAQAILSDAIGIEIAPHVHKKLGSQEASAITPAIWYRFREGNLGAEDRELVLLVRRLGYFLNELEEITDVKAVAWRTLFQAIRDSIDPQKPPRVQGFDAANVFREFRSLDQGVSGIGEVLRGYLRAIGILVVESPLPQSKIEGCAFFVGSRPNERPCVFANNHGTTWFRRNEIILHEVAHAIFDAASEGAGVDFSGGGDESAVREQRADAFAQQVLVPKRVISHLAQKVGIQWNSLTEQALAQLVADTHSEPRLILRSAFECGLITEEERANYLKLDISTILPGLTDHALSAPDFIRKRQKGAPEWIGKRDITRAGVSLRLPPTYVNAVVEACKSYQISEGKAAEMLMIEREDFRERFGPDPADADFE